MTIDFSFCVSNDQCVSQVVIAEAVGGKSQFPWWPITVSMENNDGRKVAGWLPELAFENEANPVVQGIEDATGEILYTIRAHGGRFHPRVYSTGKHTIMLGLNRPNATILSGVEPKTKDESGQHLNVKVN